MKTIYFGSDHRGFGIKEELKQFIQNMEFRVVDFSSSSLDPEDDYVDIGLKVGEKVALENELGVLICGSGVGMCVAANKVAGVRAGLCSSARQARRGREEDAMNVLCLSAELQSVEELEATIAAFLESEFVVEDKYVRRLNKIKKYENTAGR